MSKEYINNQDIHVSINADATWSIYVNEGNTWTRNGDGMEITVYATNTNGFLRVTVEHDPEVFEEVTNDQD